MRRLETTQYAALLTALFALSSPGIAEAQLSALSGAGAGANVSQIFSWLVLDNQC